ncbi:MAG: polyphosphate kinase 1, partial [Bdellovibrionales bacterium]|nr:polyphosphate kinase 1 [Bdellovibrionales bacterium]
MTKRKLKTRRSAKMRDRSRQQASSRYNDRELSWLEFDNRVLQQAEDKNLPILERLKFLNIFHTNLDEFFMKRIAGPRLISMEENANSNSEHMIAIRARVENLILKASKLFEEDIRQELEKSGVRIVKWKELSADDKIYIRKYYEERIFPLLVPTAVDSAHPFPHISNLSTSLAVSLKYPGRSEVLFSRVKIPSTLPSWIEVPTSGIQSRWIPIRDVVEKNLESLFPKMEIINTLAFRVTRNIDLERDEEEADDMLAMIEEELKERRFGEVVKLEVGPNPDQWLLEFLRNELGLSIYDLYINPSEYEFIDFGPILKVERPELKFEKWNPVTPKELAEDSGDIFTQIQQGDIFVHHPYDSFTSSVERFLQAAADDPAVLAIRMTLYRTNEDGSLIRSLIRAAEKGKTVVVVVELKARFDEERNINWARSLEDAGVHILFGLVGLKTHSKTTLIVRQEGSRIRSYAHIGTGNYHSQTAKLYTDIGILTCNEEITQDLIHYFHFLTGRSLKDDYKHLLVAPINMKRRVLELIANEIKFAKAGKKAEILIKINNLEDRDIIERLYEASGVGVKVRLIVRGICVLKPKVKEMSENIEVISVVDRFLEHSRIFAFRSGEEELNKGFVIFGSADLMYRNLERRVEVFAP